MNKIILSLGSNLGDRRKILMHALKDINVCDSMQLAKTSPIIETTPVDNSDQPLYLNMVAEFITSLSPFKLLELTQKIENMHGRIRKTRWGPRTLDIDIITYGDKNINHKNLIIPHPRSYERAFVLYPWYIMDRHASFPDGKTVDSFLKKSIGYRDIMKNYEK